MAHLRVSNSFSEAGAWLIVGAYILSSSSEAGAWLIVGVYILSSSSEASAWLIVEGLLSYHYLLRQVQGS